MMIMSVLLPGATSQTGRKLSAAAAETGLKLSDTNAKICMGPNSGVPTVCDGA